MARRRKNRDVKRGTFITPRVAAFTQHRDYWPSTPSYTKRVALRYTPLPTYQPSVLYERAGVARPRGRRVSRHINPYTPVSGMHDTRFKRPSISPYDVWKNTIAFVSPTTKTCVQRKLRREAVFAQTGGGSIRRKHKNTTTLRSQIRCK
ncbi:MAG: hypothetical protein [Microviridae sp.]|nr:MAG: hypothetical protein [Microviridae sp.]